MIDTGMEKAGLRLAPLAVWDRAWWVDLGEHEAEVFAPVKGLVTRLGC